MKRIGNLALCVLILMSTFAVAYERQEQDGVVVTAHMFNNDQNEIVISNIDARFFKYFNVFPVQIVVENNSQSKLLLDPHNFTLELADTYNMASCLCMCNARYNFCLMGSSFGFLLSLIPLIATPLLQQALSNYCDWDVRSTVAVSGLGFLSLLITFGIKKIILAGEIKNNIKANLEMLNNPITINPGEAIKRTLFFEMPQEVTAIFYVTDQTNGKLLTFEFEIE